MKKIIYVLLIIVLGLNLIAVNTSFSDPDEPDIRIGLYFNDAITGVNSAQSYIDLNAKMVFY